MEDAQTHDNANTRETPSNDVTHVSVRTSSQPGDSNAVPGRLFVIDIDELAQKARESPYGNPNRRSLVQPLADLTAEIVLHTHPVRDVHTGHGSNCHTTGCPTANENVSSDTPAQPGAQNAGDAYCQMDSSVQANVWALEAVEQDIIEPTRELPIKSDAQPITQGGGMPLPDDPDLHALPIAQIAQGAGISLRDDPVGGKWFIAQSNQDMNHHGYTSSAEHDRLVDQEQNISGYLYCPCGRQLGTENRPETRLGYQFRVYNSPSDTATGTNFPEGHTDLALESSVYFNPGATLESHFDMKPAANGNLPQHDALDRLKGHRKTHVTVHIGQPCLPTVHEHDMAAANVDGENRSTFRTVVRQLSRGLSKRYSAIPARHQRTRRPNCHFELSLFACVCCLSPLGFVALIMSALASSRYEEGDVQGADRYSFRALVLGVAGIITTIVIAAATLAISATVYYSREQRFT